MALALRDAGFKNAGVNVGTIVLDRFHYRVDNVLIAWQRNAMYTAGKGMIPMAMKVDRKRRLVEFVQEC